MKNLGNIGFSFFFVFFIEIVNDDYYRFYVLYALNFFSGRSAEVFFFKKKNVLKGNRSPDCLLEFSNQFVQFFHLQFFSSL